MVAGHPFKGGWIYSVGQLEHPDLKRFQINTPVFFKPVIPGKNPYEPVAQVAVMPAFS